MNFEDISGLSKQQFGKELAEKFIDTIENKSAYSRAHPGYCGWIAGFQKKEQKFVFTRSWEGYINGIDGTEPDLTWNLSQKEELIDWLSQQSDYSMSGGDTDSKIYGFGYINNQTISETKMKEFITDAENGIILYDPFNS